MAKPKFEKTKKIIEIKGCKKQRITSMAIVIIMVDYNIRIISNLNYIKILLKNKKIKYIIIIKEKYNLIYYLFIFNNSYFLNNRKILYLWLNSYVCY